MHLILYLPHRLRKQTPYMPHLRKSTHKGTQLCRNSELAYLKVIAAKKAQSKTLF